MYDENRRISCHISFRIELKHPPCWFCAERKLGTNKKYPGSSASERCFEMSSLTSGLLRTKAGLVTCK